MTTEPVPIIAGAVLFLLAATAAVWTTRRLTEHSTPAHGRPRGALGTLTWLLVTTALGVGAAALWAGPGLDLSSTWPFAVALAVALAPLGATAVFRKRHGTSP